MLLALLAIWTNADYSWPKPLTMCCAGGRRWCCAGSPSALMVLLCVWCVVGIGARAHQERDEREVHTAAPKVRPHARACAHTRPRHRRAVGERPHVRGSVERTASLAVAKTRCRGGQTRCPGRAELPLQGIPSEKAASGGCGPISTNHVALFGLSCTRFYPAPCFGHIPARCTLFWPLPQKNSGTHFDKTRLLR